MAILPLQHFRRGVAQYASTPEAFAMMFAGTGVSREMMASPDFDLTPQLLWKVCDNLTERLGPGWYLNLPALWSLDVQSDIESAMRFAPTLGAALTIVERYGSHRWPIVRWQNTIMGGHLHSSSYRNEVISPSNWQMLGVLFTLNFQTILETAFPSALPHIVHEIAGPPPVPETEVAKLFRYQVRWNAPTHAAIVPKSMLETPSTLADTRAFSALLATLEAKPVNAPVDWQTRTTIALSDTFGRRQSSQEVSSGMGLSLRSLERYLASEGTSFRAVRDEFLKGRLEALVQNSDFSLAAMAEQLGYSDESALSRATRRWYGCSAAEARKRIRSGKWG